MPFDFLNDVFLQNLPLEAAERILERLAFLELYLSQLSPLSLSMIANSPARESPTCGYSLSFTMKLPNPRVSVV